MRFDSKRWRTSLFLTVVLLAVVALLAPAGLTLAQDGDKGTPDPPASVLDGRNAGSPAGDGGPKNASDGQTPAGPLAEGGGLIPCSATADAWTTTSSSYEPVAECTIYAPGPGRVLVIADAWMRYDNDHYEAAFTIALGNAQDNVERFVDVYSDGGDGTDRALSLATLRSVSGSGAHTFTLQGRLEGGVGTVKADDVILSVLYIPDSSDLEVCSVLQYTSWYTTDSSYDTIHTCTLNAAEPGWVYMIGNGTGNGSSGHPYEAQYSVDVDETDGDLDATRWFNYYGDSYADGTDGSVTVSALRYVSAGAHDVNFLGQRWDGVSTVWLEDPTLIAVFIPEDSARAQTCGSEGPATWTTTSATFASAVSCGVDVPGNSWAFVSANGTLGEQNGDYEAQLRLGLDNTSGLTWTDRYYNITTDSGDGMDRPLSLTSIVPVAQGHHTFHLLGARWTGPGDVVMRYPTISVLVPGGNLFLPAMLNK